MLKFQSFFHSPEQSDYRSSDLSGENLCATTWVPGTETCSDSDVLVSAPETQTGNHIWDQDANEMLGLYSCLVTAATLASGGLLNTLDATLQPTTTADTEFLTEIWAKMKTIDNSFANDQPYTIFAGADRGALTAQIALARAGYYLYDTSLEKALRSRDTKLKSVTRQLKSIPSSMPCST